MIYIKRSPIYFLYRLFPRIGITWLLILIMSELISYSLLLPLGMIITVILSFFFSLQWCSGIQITNDDVAFIKLFSVRSYRRDTLTTLDFDEKSKTLLFKFKDSKTIMIKGGFKMQQFSDLDVFTQGK